MMVIKKVFALLAVWFCIVSSPLAVTLQWDANTESDLAGYNIYRSQTYRSGYIKVNQNIITSTSFVDTPPQYLDTYYYVATALNTSGLESGYSNQVQYDYVCHGDANLDGIITVSDAVVISRHIVGAAPLSGLALEAADANNDGNVTVSDVTKIQLMVVGLNPIECP